jgi:hypothetical protein
MNQQAVLQKWIKYARDLGAPPTNQQIYFTTPRALAATPGQEENLERKRRQ